MAFEDFFASFTNHSGLVTRECCDGNSISTSFVTFSKITLLFTKLKSLFISHLVLKQPIRSLIILLTVLEQPILCKQKTNI